MVSPELRPSWGEGQSLPPNGLSGGEGWLARSHNKGKLPSPPPLA